MGILAAWDIFPVNNGASMRIYDTASALSELIEVDVYSPPFRLPGYKGEGFFSEKNRFRYIYVSGIIDRLMEKLPLDNVVAKFLLNYRPWLGLEIAIKKKRVPDVIHAEQMFSSITGYILKKIWRRPFVLVMHNVDFLLTKDIYGCVFSEIERLITKLVVKRADKVVCVSKDDEDKLAKEFKIHNIKIIPNSINLKRYTANLKQKSVREEMGVKADEKIIFFHGLLSYLPNLEAVKTIVKKIAPKVLSKSNNVKFVIVGDNPPYNFAEDIVFTGGVRDIVPFINEADICIAYLEKGSGTRLKILEYMACAKPVVSTPKGVEGLEVEHCKNIIIANTVDGFCEQIIDLIEDDEKRRLLGEEARRLVEEKYNWNINARRYIEIYKELV